MKETAADKILKRLCESRKPLAVHEFNIIGTSETAISARLRELSRSGKVVGTRREGTDYKEWALVREGELGLVGCITGMKEL